MGLFSNISKAMNDKDDIIRAEIEYREQAKKELEAIRERMLVMVGDSDAEMDHSDGDGLLIEALEVFQEKYPAIKEIIEIWNNIEKWYA